jgi:hypothetical protein
MVKNTVEAFNSFYDRIKPSVSMGEKVEARKAAVIDTLTKAFPPTSNVRFRKSWLIGSLGRKTASKPVADIDLLVYLDVEPKLWDEAYRDDSTKFLYRVRSSLSATSTVQKVGARGQAVRLFYSDGLTVDVAAVEKYTSGDYAIPNGSGGWLTTNPLRHAEYLDEENAKLSGDLKRFIQIAKQWNITHSSRLRSFHFEMLAAGTFTSLDNDRRKALEVFFDHIHYNLSVQDPAGHSGDLSSYLLPNQREQVNRSLAVAKIRAAQANAAELRGDHEESIRLWRSILGNDFPTYG